MDRQFEERLQAMERDEKWLEDALARINTATENRQSLYEALMR